MVFNEPNAEMGNLMFLCFPSWHAFIHLKIGGRTIAVEERKTKLHSSIATSYHSRQSKIVVRASFSAIDLGGLVLQSPVFPRRVNYVVPSPSKGPFSVYNIRKKGKNNLVN